MKQAVFLKDADKVSIYKAVFASATLQMVIGLDPADKLEAFAFQPYEDESAGKTGPVASNNPLVTAQDRIVDSVALGYMRRLAPVGLSIGILRNGKTSFYGYGEATKGEGNVPGARTLFEIGSITKTFTATMLGLAVGEGKMSLDDPVNKYLPDSIPPLEFHGRIVTIRDLSNHTGGIPRMPDNFQSKVSNGNDPYADYTVNDLYGWLRTLRLTREPGSRFEYSNAGVGLLGTI